MNDPRLITGDFFVLFTSNIPLKMFYAICYVSTAKDFLSLEIKELLSSTAKNNQENSISGILIYNSGNFLQYMEGPERKVKDLYYEKISKDKRHKDLITLFKNPINNLYFNGYETGFTSVLEKNTITKLKSYVQLLKYLDTQEAKAVTSTIEAFLGKSPKQS